MEGIGLESVGVEPNPKGIEVDGQLRFGENLWAIGDVTGIFPLTHTGKYQSDVVAANILGGSHEANYDAVPRVVFTDPQAASVGATEARFSATAKVKEVPRMATYTRQYDKSNGFLTLLSDGEGLTGAYALGPEAGEWLQQATLAIRARVPIDVLRDTIQPFPTFSEIYVAGAEVARRGDLGQRLALAGGAQDVLEARHRGVDPLARAGDVAGAGVGVERVELGEGGDVAVEGVGDPPPTSARGAARRAGSPRPARPARSRSRSSRSAWSSSSPASRSRASRASRASARTRSSRAARGASSSASAASRRSSASTSDPARRLAARSSTSIAATRRISASRARRARSKASCTPRSASRAAVRSLIRPWSVAVRSRHVAAPRARAAQRPARPMTRSRASTTAAAT